MTFIAYAIVIIVLGYLLMPVTVLILGMAYTIVGTVLNLILRK